MLPRLSKAQSFQPTTFTKSNGINASTFVPSFAPSIQAQVPQSMPEFKMNFKATARRANF